MKILVETATNLVKYVFENSDMFLWIGPRVDLNPMLKGFYRTNSFKIGDLDPTVTTFYTGVLNVPADFIGDKYTYDGSDFTLNPNWTEE